MKVLKHPDKTGKKINVIIYDVNNTIDDIVGRNNCDFHLRKMKRTVHDFVKSGIESWFIQMTKKTGVKIFMSKPECRRAMRRQKKAWKHLAAPKVLSDKPEQFAMQLDGDIYIRWGYRTEYARPIKTAEDGRRFNYEVEDLALLLESCGLSGCDLHDQNVGFVGRNLVCIDYGDISQ
jgi:hypothetical protein